jgi:hypothetical protein
MIFGRTLPVAICSSDSALQPADGGPYQFQGRYRPRTDSGFCPPKFRRDHREPFRQISPSAALFDHIILP